MLFRSQQMGSIELNPISLEITYGIERIAMFLFDSDNCYDLEWAKARGEDREIRYGDLTLEQERQFSRYNFKVASVELYSKLFEMYSDEFDLALNEGLVLPAYDALIHAGHAFNMLDARGAISVAGRAAYIGRVRAMARKAAETWVAQREALGHPLRSPWKGWRNLMGNSDNVKEGDNA